MRMKNTYTTRPMYTYVLPLQICKDLQKANEPARVMRGPHVQCLQELASNIPSFLFQSSVLFLLLPLSQVKNHEHVSLTVLL